MKRFTDLTLSDAQNLVAATGTEMEQTSLRFIKGDQWNNGADWVGPMPAQDSTLKEKIKGEIAKEFTFYNVCREAVWRHSMAVIGREPQWGAQVARVLDDNEQLTDDEKTQITELDELMQAWADDPLRCCYVDDQGREQTGAFHELLQRAVRSYVASGRAVLRLFIPPDALLGGQEGGEGEGETTALGTELKKLPLPEALARIHVELCENQHACVTTRRQSMTQIGIVLMTDTESGQAAATSAELCYLDENKQTILRTVQGGSADGLQRNEDGQAGPFDLGGNLLHLQLGGDGLVSPSMLSQQKDVNRRLTMSGRNSNLAGFPERVLLDAELDGEYVDDPRAVNGKRFVPKPLTVGAGTINNFRGRTIVDDEGAYLDQVPAKYSRLDPVGSDIFDSGVEAARKRMLGEVHQEHALIGGDATASGVSREQARHEFEVSLGDTAAKLAKAGLWVLTTALRLAVATSTETANPYDALRMTFEARVDSGPRSAEERTADREDVAAGLLAPETAMSRGEVTDVDAERARVIASRTAAKALPPATMKDRADVVYTLSQAGVGVEAAALVSGFNEEDAKKLGQTDFTPEPATE